MAKVDEIGVRGRSAATAATAGHAICQVWNPHATKRIRLLNLGIWKVAAGTAGDAVEIRRSTVRGTPGSTVTPGIAQSYNRDVVPQSGFLLDLAAFTVQPTLETGGLIGWVAANVAASGIYMPFGQGGITVPPGTGIVAVQIAATSWPISEITALVEE